MKVVLLSIRPEWCEKIASGQKTIEVRKNRPKLETPFKCYIYCTKSKTSDKSGKVIGEFVCDQIYQWSSANVEGINISKDEITKMSCLTEDELFQYEYSSEPQEGCYYLLGLYGWHISDLVIYDKPKELSEFTGLKQTRFGGAPYKMQRPPQSWCYVEEHYSGCREV